MEILKQKAIKFLLWSQKYTRTDMVYAIKGSFWIMAGKAVTTLISLAVLAIFTKLVSQQTYGDYQYVLSIAGLFSILSLPGLATALTKSIAQGYEGSLFVAFLARLRWSTLGSLGLLAVSAWYIINENVLLASTFFIVALLLPLQSSAPIFSSFWNGKKRFELQAFYDSFSTLAAGIVLVATLFFTDNLALIILAFSGASAFFDGILYLHTQNKVRNNGKDEKLLPLGKQLTVMTMFVTIAQYVDKIILWKLLGPVEVALYSLALIPIQKVKISIPITALALPQLSAHGASGEKRKRDIFRKFLLLFALSIPFSIILSLIGPIFFKLFFPDYIAAVKYFQVLTAWISFSPFLLLETALVAETKTRALYLIQIGSPLTKIALFFILAPFYGVWGLVMAIIAAEIFRSCLTLYLFKRL